MVIGAQSDLHSLPAGCVVIDGVARSGAGVMRGDNTCRRNSSLLREARMDTARRWEYDPLSEAGRYLFTSGGQMWPDFMVNGSALGETDHSTVTSSPTT